MKTDRPDWNARLADTAGEMTRLIEDYEQDMVARKCVVEVTFVDLSWKKYGKDKTWRILRGEKPLTEAPLAERARYGLVELEGLADAADAGMDKLMASFSKESRNVTETKKQVAGLFHDCSGEFCDFCLRMKQTQDDNSKGEKNG